MNRIFTELQIEAPPERVWQEITNFGDYPNWNPFILELKGELKVGSRLTVTMQPPGMRTMTVSPTVVQLDPHHHFSWGGKLLIRGLLDAEHRFELERLPNGSTRWTHREDFRGVLAPLFFALVGKRVQPGFEAMNRELKRRCEEQS